MFLGVDPAELPAFAGQLTAVGSTLDGVMAEVLQAEMLSEVTTGVHGQLASIEATAMAAMAAVTAAVDQVESFRITIDRAWRGAHVRVGPGWFTADDRSDAHEQFDLVFADVAEAIRRGLTPEQAGLDEDWFPPGYVDWHVLQGRIEAVQQELYGPTSAGPAPSVNGELTSEERAQAEIVRLRETQLALGLGVLGPDGSASRNDAAVLVSDFLGGRFDLALGGYLASTMSGGSAEDTDGADDIALTREVVLSSPSVTAGWFRSLSVDGLTGLMHDWAILHPAEFEEVLPEISAALAVQSKTGLGYSGADLVNADTAFSGHQMHETTTAFHNELLLLAPGFNSEFLSSAVRASQERAEAEMLMGAEEWQLDRQLTAIGALVVNGASADFVQGSTVGETANMVLEIPVAYGQAHPTVIEMTGASPLTLFMSAVGESSSATEHVIASLTSKAHDVDLHDVVLDPRLAVGTSLMLAHRSIDLLDSPHADFESDYLQVYELVLRSGAGDEVALAGGSEVVIDYTASALESGDYDLDKIAGVVAGVEETRFRVRSENARTADAAQHAFEDLVGNLSRVSSTVGVGSLAAPPLAATVGAASSVIGLGLGSFGSGQADARQKQYLQQLNETFDSLGLLTNHFALGAVRSGLVLDASGHRVTMDRLDDSTDDVLENSVLVDATLGSRLLADWVREQAQETFNLIADETAPARAAAD